MSDEIFLYLTTTGWKSGNQHTIEIWFVEADDKYFILAETRYEAHWVQNIQHRSEVVFYMAKRDEQDVTTNKGVGRVIEDAHEPELARRVKELMKAKYGWDNGLIVELATISTL